MTEMIFRPLAGLLLLVAACGTPSGASPAPGGRTVVVISLDGFPAYMFDDPRLPAPTLRRMIREGASAHGMTICNPTVTWPNHTTLATGVPPIKHGVLFNGLLSAPPGGPAKVEQKDRSVLVRVPTIYDAAHRAGLRTAAVDWVPPESGGPLDWSFEENPRPEGPVEREMVAAGLISAPDLVDFKKGNPPWRDVMWTRAAVHILKAHHPDLLLFHLLNLDATHHKYGPKTPAGLTAIALADARVAEILEAIEEAGLKDRTTVLVVSDHGFKGTTKSIRPNAALRQAGLLKVEGAQITECQASVVPEGGTAMVYFKGSDAALGSKVRDALQGLDGVEKIWEPGSYAELGMPQPADNPQMPPLILVAKPGYGFAGLAVGEPVVDVIEGMTVGLHGYPAEDPDMNAIFIAWGRGVRKGARVETLKNVDVAPTVAALLGIRMEGVDGSPASSLLDLPGSR